MREWEAEQGRMHAGIYLCPVCGVSIPSIPKLSNDLELRTISAALSVTMNRGMR
jgi:hypothetical protein